MKVSRDSETLTEGQQVITACAFIHQDFGGVEKVFLPKRATSKKFLPGVYELPGGHIDFGEDIITGLKREIMEEFGKKVEVGDVFASFSYTNKIKKSHSIEVIYFAKFTGDINSISLNAEDHSDYGWFAEDELEMASTADKSLEDVEFKAIAKGFSLLNGRQLQF